MLTYYTIENVGRLVVLAYHYDGVSCDLLDDDGGSLGVAPEALVARAKIVGAVPVKSKALETTVAEEAQQMVPEAHIVKLLGDLSYTDRKTQDCLEMLKKYSTQK